MSSITPIPNTPCKSDSIVINCIFAMLKLARKRKIKACMMVFVDAGNQYHFSNVGPLTDDQKDKMLDALEQMHEMVFTATTLGKRDY